MQLFLLEETRERKFDSYARLIQKAFKKHFSAQKLLKQKEEASGIARVIIFSSCFNIFARHFLSKEGEEETFSQQKFLLRLHWAGTQVSGEIFLNEALIVF